MVDKLKFCANHPTRYWALYYKATLALFDIFTLIRTVRLKKLSPKVLLPLKKKKNKKQYLKAMSKEESF